MSGAFDAIENIGQPTSRFRLIQEYHKLTKAKIDKEKDIFTIYRDNVKYDWWWTLQQKQLSGIAFFDYKTILERYLDTDDRIIDIEDFQSEYMQRKRVRICGYLSEVEIKNSKKGQYCILLLECNYTFVTVKIWSEQFESLAEKMNIQEQEKKLILINGLIVWDNFKGENVLQATEDTEIVVLE
jgi:hypothetical protein